MDSQNKLASILINNYNYAQFVGQAIESALNQTYKNIEVIVVDDGSTDNSRSVIESFGDRIKAIYKENAGQASAFNAGFAANQGEFIFILDADDLFLSHKVEKIIQEFQDNPKANWLFHELSYIDRLGDSININKDSAVLNFELIDLQETLRKGKKFNYSIPCGLCFRRSLLNQILPMPQASNIVLSDNYLKFASLALSAGILWNEHLAFQRIHQSNHFTFRDDVQVKASEIGLMTGYYLREQFPAIALFADKVFAKGLGELIAELGWKQAFKIPEASQYFKNFWSIQDRLKYFPRIGFHCLRTQLAKHKRK
ncbi:MAG: glucosyl transferase [Pseudanabaena frigida]|uniref:Glucosyl transferase n=1 Tax=Pseudanabaena frigida TaxID=945775 RepID=A0A2W4WCG8_9CYAN|nr:MAG: glucosyl transferase [Pseudanabaena frigida]